MLLTKNSRWPWLVYLILFAGFLTNSISSYVASRSNMRLNIIESTLPLTSDNVYSEIQRDLLSPVFISSLMANDTFLRDWALNGEVDTSLITKFLHEIKIQYSTVSSFFVSDISHNYYHAHGLLKTVKEDEPRDAWYFNTKDIDVPYEINVDLDLANQDQMTIFINYRVFDYADNFIGMTGVGLTVRNVNNLISHYEAKFHRQIYFLNTDGEIVLRPSNSPLMKYPSLQEIPGLDDAATELLAQERSAVTYQRDGTTYMLNCRYIPELDWFLIVEQNEQELLKPIKEQLLFNLLLSLLVTAIVACICGSVIRRTHISTERRHAELTLINHQNEIQKAELSLSAEQLSSANQKLSELNKEKDDFISIVAHDLRNPLNGILGLCQLADLDLDSHEFDQASFVSDVRTCGQRMLALTQSLLDVSRIEAFHGKIDLEPINCNDMIETIAADYHNDAQKKKISIQFDLAPDDKSTVYSKPDWLPACITNVISNAVKYTPIGGKVIISSHHKEDRFEIQIKDNGPGISSDEQELLFTKFARLSAKPTANETSTGLGLYLVKKMCERLSVEIRVQSELGEGTTFILSCPTCQNPHRT
jgi:signal transduction histidine kinase